MDDLDSIEKNALEALKGVQDEDALAAWRVTHLGRSSPLMRAFDALGGLPKEQRPLIGRRANEVKRLLEAALAEKSELMRQAALSQSLAGDRLDVTLPGRPQLRGRLHPIQQTLREIARVFAEMGFQVYRSR